MELGSFEDVALAEATVLSKQARLAEYETRKKDKGDVVTQQGKQM